MPQKECAAARRWMRRPSRPSSSGLVTSKSDRRAARQAVAAYHEDQLGELVHHVGDAIEQFRAGELNAFEVDELVFQYSRAAKELWKFCNLGNVEIAARMIRDEPPGGWWERRRSSDAMTSL